MDISHCKICNAKLVAGPFVERSLSARGFAVRVSGIPTNICPNSCPGQYWYWLDFGVEVLDSVTDSPNIAKRKGLLRFRHQCRTCGSGLVDLHRTWEFHFPVQLHNGKEVSMVIDALSLTRLQCNANYIPAQLSTGDAYHSNLASTISDTITHDLIYK